MNKEVKNELFKMLPNELEKIKDLVETLLNELGLKKETNQKYQMINKKILCPNCISNLVVKNGHKNNTQRFKCNNCNKFFSITTDTIINHSKLNYNTLIKIIENMLEVKCLEKLAQDVKMSAREIYNIRIKIISVLNNYYRDDILEEVVEADEKYIRLSFKGTRAGKMPRKSRHSGHEDLTCGISKEQVCVVGAIDSYDHIVLKVVGLGPASKNMISKALKDKIKVGTILVTDSKKSYIKFAKENKLTLKQIPDNYHVIEEIYNLSSINQLFGELEIFLKRFNGLSTRHLQQYLDWFRYKKILKYVVEYLNQKEELYRFSINQKSKLKTRNICTTPMPVDVSEVYDKPFK